MKNEEWFCKRHDVDHYGSWCGSCVILWKKKADKLDTARMALKNKDFKKVKTTIGGKL